MTMKFRPDPDYRTKAVLLSDDEVHYKPLDMEFAFQTWRKQGQYRLTGPFARCVKKGKLDRWIYHNCKGMDYYSLALTGLVFTHVSYLEYFWSDNALMTKLREYVDEVFNCDDLAFNYMVAMLTCSGPLQVIGKVKAHLGKPKHGISTKPNHWKVRHQCLNDYADMFGYMPLMNTTEHLVRAMVRL
ncbi:hypothetical protein QQZ08_002043 [Neonectria magnoliae]|uniref:Glycosyl transferase 64 domain-containing protein n=1 Tax=Neonectria magnoliae TaxID=2732573 RepID=A0ABR1IE82_9HYPO